MLRLKRKVIQARDCSAFLTHRCTPNVLCIFWCVWIEKCGEGHKLGFWDEHNQQNTNLINFLLQIMDLLIFYADTCSHTGLLSRRKGLPVQTLYKDQANFMFIFPCYQRDIRFLGRKPIHVWSMYANPLINFHFWKCKHIKEQNVTKALRNMNKPSDHVCSTRGCLIKCYWIQFRTSSHNLVCA